MSVYKFNGYQYKRLAEHWEAEYSALIARHNACLHQIVELLDRVAKLEEQPESVKTAPICKDCANRLLEKLRVE